MTTQHYIVSRMSSEAEFQSYLSSLEQVLDTLKETLITATKERYEAGAEVMTQQSVVRHISSLLAHVESAYLFEEGSEKDISTNVAHTAYRAVLLAHAWSHRYGVPIEKLFDDNAIKP